MVTTKACGVIRVVDRYRRPRMGSYVDVCRACRMRRACCGALVLRRRRFSGDPHTGVIEFIAGRCDFLLGRLFSFAFWCVLVSHAHSLTPIAGRFNRRLFQVVGYFDKKPAGIWYLMHRKNKNPF